MSRDSTVVSHRWSLGRWRAQLAQAVDALPASPEASHRVALALALGAFFGFSPFLGLQTLFAMGIALLARLNKTWVFVGLNLNLPFVLPAYYLGVTLAGRSLVGGTGCSGQAVADLLAHSWLSREFWRLVAYTSAGCFRPFVAGSLVGGACVAACVYLVSKAALNARAKR